MRDTPLCFVPSKCTLSSKLYGRRYRQKLFLFFVYRGSTGGSTCGIGCGRGPFGACICIQVNVRPTDLCDPTSVMTASPCEGRCSLPSKLLFSLAAMVMCPSLVLMLWDALSTIGVGSRNANGNGIGLLVHLKAPRTPPDCVYKISKRRPIR